MKSLLSILLISFLVTISKAQDEVDRHLEIGGMIGGLNYTGDIAPDVRLSNTRPGISLFYRHNFPNEVSVLRANIMMGSLTANEADTKNPLPESRNYSFNRQVSELALIYEYDFFNFRDLKNQFYMSPYLFGGLGITVIWGEGSPNFINIPFGAGVKYKISEHVNLGVEFGARKNFSDKLDGYTDNEVLNSSSKNDWYYFGGITVSYTFYRIICKQNMPFRI